MKYAYESGSRCIYCGTVFNDAHPISLELINGYPSPCRKIGFNAVWCWSNEIWLETVVEYSDYERQPANV